MSVSYTHLSKAKELLNVYINAARLRGEPIDHCLLYGPPGLGKTTLAGVIANEMGVSLRVTSGPAIEKAKDLATLLSKLNENDILFVDEIHRLNPAVEEVLYPAMEDYAFDIITVSYTHLNNTNAQNQRTRLSVFWIFSICRIARFSYPCLHITSFAVDRRRKEPAGI